eukprot:CAMPEP_0206241480 /NCGR_PEP_ID=MMETSP0047_2-20121206/16515_1 /ASSEMBLY_ACC=CAM_ASM_000192 /TAXON_ID=195065 /ORGANISM="Chroomonas mesostigmatica_cf, Strain CCMP1168" /LENGTH=66 /DNA_ID=CAMNT_0053666373 /DNA_START=108 /DNA_END=308 /DNA_ORIENTATION=+
MPRFEPPSSVIEKELCFLSERVGRTMVKRVKETIGSWREGMRQGNEDLRRVKEMENRAKARAHLYK